MKIVFTGGGTAGHIFPIIAIIREMRRINPSADFQFFYVGPNDKFVKNLFADEGVEVRIISAGKIRRYFSLKNIIDIFFKIPFGFFQAFYHIFVISPDLVFSKGGYGSVPVVFASWLLLVPIFIHESDSSPGLANRIASRFALEIFISFPVEKTLYFPSDKMISVGNPVREMILKGPKKDPKKILSLTGEKPVLLFLGGSQGAQRMNDEILSNLSGFLESFEVIHQTGRENFEEVVKESKVMIKKGLEKYYHPFSFLNEIELAAALKVSDIVVSRAGAGAIFEIAAAGKPSILVPLENSAQDHQIKNAYAFAETGAALVIEDPNFKSHFLLRRIKQIFKQPRKLKEMALRAKEFSNPDAGRIIAEYIIAYLER
ncbi:MAG TPA: undecaprenyldiphospho-muramoylpentapeptide beta-N-acetylglucosaminyltransferase [Candidatus Parcubacteria bacterium]|nr:undecaprenyldiphospho-muramoylpentapeptide beta-N-acetylglucosaminyltransferase [Candidatus Parcubacteria bacterium]